MPEQTCQHPTDRCATCGRGPRRHGPKDPAMSFPMESHIFTPAPCGEALVRGMHTNNARKPAPWRCPVHGEAVTA